MTSTLLKITLTPQSPFITPMASDTLFGQLCWAIRHNFGEAKLAQLLDGYTQGQPFVVLSNTLPQGYIPRPTLPLSLLGYNLSDTDKRKETKKKLWLHTGDAYALLSKPVSAWHNDSYSLGEMISIDEQNDSEENAKVISRAWEISVTQPHNSLNRLTNTTGSEGGFSPFNRQATYHHPKSHYDIYAVLDECRFSQAELMDTLNHIGAFGYGKEASSGAGKFTVSNIQAVNITPHAQANAYLTLGFSTPQGLDWQNKHCYYNTSVRFGRHGAEAVYMGNPFKNPVLMVVTGAVLTPKDMTEALFIGNGLSGLSKVVSGTVQQGYAPVLPIYLDTKD